MRKNFDPFDKEIGIQIKEARKAKGYRAQDIADFLGIYKSTYFYYEAGKVSFSFSRFIKLCNYLGIDYIEVMENARRQAINKNGK